MPEKKSLKERLEDFLNGPGFPLTITAITAIGVTSIVILSYKSNMRHLALYADYCEQKSEMFAEALDATTEAILSTIPAK